VPDLNVESDSVGHQDDLNDLEGLREMALERTSHAHQAVDKRSVPRCPTYADSGFR
ncbi:hypothetical protein U1Q18_017632, partial [Sarracenia purpurea var. burkii]